VYRFKYVFLAILVRMAAYILDYVSFDKRDFVYRYEFSWLNLHMLVMLPTYLFITVFL